MVETDDSLSDGRSLEVEDNAGTTEVQERKGVALEASTILPWFFTYIK